jgi:methionine-rich copper-binding protein CopC
MRNRTTIGVLTATATATGILLAVAAPLTATAHDFLVSSNPIDGATVTSLPDKFSVTANAELLDLAGDGSGFGILVSDAAGLYYGDGCPTVDGPTLSTEAALGEPGTYSMTWQVVSSDGHPASGEMSFTWAPNDSAELSAGSESTPVCGETVISPLQPAAAAEPTAAPEASAVSASEPTSEAPANPAAPWIIGGGVAAMLIGIGGMVWLWSTKQGPFRHRGL